MHSGDQASALALAFVAGRLDGESVAVVFGERDPGAVVNLTGVPDRRLRVCPIRRSGIAGLDGPGAAGRARP